MLLLPLHPLLALSGLTGCQEPFDRDRTDLVGLRVASVTADVREGSVRPRVALIVDGKPWSDAAASIDWFWIDRPGEAVDRVSGSLGVGFGPAPTIPLPEGDDAQRLAVVVALDGEERRAEIAVSPSRRRVDVGLETGALALDVQSVADDDLPLDARRALDAQSAHAVEPGGFARFAVAGAPDLQARFMGTRHSGAGTFFALDDTTTDWVAGDLLVDEGVIESRAVGPEGPVSILGLALGADRSGLAVADFWVGDVPIGVWSNGRFLPTDAPVEAAEVWGTLSDDDDAPSGLALVDVEATSPDDPSFDAADLPCVATTGPVFDPNWLLDHRCLRSDLMGERVRVRVDADIAEVP
jgi:hypothetical protein